MKKKIPVQKSHQSQQDTNVSISVDRVSGNPGKESVVQSGGREEFIKMGSLLLDFLGNKSSRDVKDLLRHETIKQLDIS